MTSPSGSSWSAFWAAVKVLGAEKAALLGVLGRHEGLVHAGALRETRAAVKPLGKAAALMASTVPSTVAVLRCEVLMPTLADAFTTQGQGRVVQC